MVRPVLVSINTGGGHFAYLFVSCDVTKNNKSIVIKLGKRIVNLLCHFYIKYYTVKLFIGYVIFQTQRQLISGHT
jgi:hypothetical protein